MDPVVIIVKDIKNGKIQLTEEELKEIVRRAYNDGYWEGKKNNFYWPYTYSGTTTGNGPLQRDITITCDSDQNTISNTYTFSGETRAGNRFQMTLDDLIGDFINN